MKSIITILFLSLITGNTFACSCVNYNLDEEFQKSEFVFKGKVKHTGSNWIWRNGNWIPHVFTEVVFDVKKSYKSKLNEKITIYTHPQTSACGFLFKEDVEYLVFTSLCSKEGDSSGFCIEARPMVHSCSPTIHFKKGNEIYENERKETIKFLEAQLSHNK